MMTKKFLFAGGAALVCGLVAVCLCPTIKGAEKVYEIQPQVSVSGYKTDAGRAIDAYERLMERYMDLTEVNLLAFSSGIKDVGKRLESIDAKLTEVCERLTRIEKALGIGEPEPPVEPKGEVGQSE